jgi:hypothetical protein
MGIAYRCDTERGLTVTVWDGHVTPDDWRALIAEQDADPAWPTPYLLGVFETAHGFATFDEAIMAEMLDVYRARARSLPVLKSAVVAQRYLEGAATIPSALGDTKVRVITFADLRPACAWLGLDAAQAQRIVDLLRDEIRVDDDKRAASN